MQTHASRPNPRRRALFVAGGLLIVFALLLVLGWEGVGVWLERNGVVLRQATVTGVLIGGVYGLVALGLTLIFGVLNIINFAHGALMTVGMYLTFLLFSNYGVDPYLSILITAPTLFLVGLVVERVIIYPARDAPEHNQLLLTLGLSLFIQNLLLLLFTATPRSIRLGYSRGDIALGPLTLDFPLRLWGTTVTLPKLAAFVFAVLLSLLLYWLLQRSDLGKAIRAVAQERDGAALVGVNVERINRLTFGLGTACVGAAAALVLPFFFVDPVAGESFNIIAFVTVVLGGMGSVPGALLGGILIGLTQELSVVFLPGSAKMLGVFVVFVLVLLFRPQGLFGRRG